jgi:RsiW-degrading membrane proteinase PrsW (M82 family)
VYIVLALVLSDQVIDGALGLFAVVTGTIVLVACIRALRPTRWKAFSLSSEWVWLGSMMVVWIAGALLPGLLPRWQHRTLPPLIVLGAGLASLWFLSATVRGLRAPVERTRLSRRLLPGHVVFLSTALSSSLSAAVALILEGLFIAGVMTVMIVTIRFLGDPATLELIEGAAQDPETLARLEEMIVTSPAALAGLGCILIFVAPAIEEASKAIPLLLFARRKARLSERTAILLGVAGGVGFAFAENVGYMSLLADNWWLVFWLRSGGAIMHGAASGFVGRAWYRGLRGGRWGAMLLDLCKGWGIHGFWNALALLVGWFAYQDALIGAVFCVVVGLVPLAILFLVLARWGIWVSER